MKYKSKVEKLNMDKAALLGLIDAMMRDIPINKREIYQNNFAFKFIDPIEWAPK